MATGWAYVNCASITGSAAGPSGSLQFKKGSPANSFTGSAALTFVTSSGTHPGNTLILTGSFEMTGNLRVDGNLDVVNINHQSVSYITSSGDSKIGDTRNDWHQFTGSISVSGNYLDRATFVVSSSGAGTVGETNRAITFGTVGINVAAPSASFHNSGSAVLGTVTRLSEGDTSYTISPADYIIGVTGSGVSNKSINIVLPRASNTALGRIVVIKDEEYFDGGNRPQNLTISASTTVASDKINGENAYYIYGSSMASITLYCDGAARWYII